MEDDSNPMQFGFSAPRCTAKSKRSGLPCKNPAVRGWTVCRMHGARGGHGPGKENPAYKHGARSGAEAKRRKMVNQLLRLVRDELDGVGGE
ncbi:HGGxSTG domain-containing protein [Ruegeria sp. 2205SS24-7]|uniref:HGGxSTG domain-containing protein n=1 Tax=Ruegeria discodermiae TaxID=3064389 RepID=UPI0027415F59|nr:HGGxSTG domain-containing protein [Ruegeria sp. 2205SS24-7]MDP5217142.1 HGGxSTG domain-containing protein [Ruegeria sp. 2205SS24-7]